MSLSASSNSRYLTPSSSSSSISTPQSTSSGETSSAEDSVPTGRFDIGLNKTRQTTSFATTNGASAAQASPAKKADDARFNPSQPPCPRPVLLLIRSLALVVGGVGLFSTIYGGMHLMTPVDPALDPKRGEHAGIMVSGLVEMLVGLVAGMQTLEDPRPRTSPSSPA